MGAPDLEDDSWIRFNEWRGKEKDVKKKMLRLKMKEREIIKLYDNILLMIHVHAGFFIVFTSSLVGLFTKPIIPIATYWIYGLIMTVAFSFFFEIICPVFSACTQLWELRFKVQKLIEGRKEIHESALTLLDNYTAIYVFASQNRDDEDSFLEELRDLEISKLEDFKSEDRVLKKRKKFYIIYPVAVGVCCLMYTITQLLVHIL